LRTKKAIRSRSWTKGGEFREKTPFSLHCDEVGVESLYKELLKKRGHRARALQSGLAKKVMDQGKIGLEGKAGRSRLGKKLSWR